MKCAQCGEEGAEIPLKNFPGSFFHKRCAFKAEYIRQWAAKGQVVQDVPGKVMRLMERAYKRAMKHPEKVLKIAKEKGLE